MPTVRLREARFEENDLEGIWELKRRLLVRNQSCSLTDFVRMCRHKWLDNPARTTDHVLGWVLESAKDGMVGFIGLVPVRLKIGSREVVGACGTTFVVMPAYRAYSLMLYKRFLDWGEKQLLLDTTSNKLGNKLNTFGMTRIPVANFDRYLLWPIRPEASLQWRLENSAWRNWSSLSARAPMSWLLMAGARVRFARHRKLRFPGPTLPVETAKDFTDEFTQFWENHKTEYGITTVRDRAYLQWRYLNGPEISGITSVFACREKGRLCGYLVIIELDSEEGTCSPGRYRVIDVFYDRSRKDVAYSLMNHAFEFAKQRGCTTFEVAKVSQELANMLETQQPYVRQAESWTYWYKVPTQELAEACRREVWWPSGSDGDSNF